MRRRRMTAAFLLPALLGVVGATASVGSVELISVTPAGGFADGESDAPALSADGRFVVFESFASNLVAAGGGAVKQIIVRDRQTHTSEMASVTPLGAPGNSFSFAPSVTPDGRYVVFDSVATDLVPGDANAKRDVFLRDRVLGTTERISVSATGGDADGDSQEATVSDDGRFVAFDSYATNLVAGDTNATSYVFVRDRQSGTTERISRAVSGEPDNYSQLPQISADGRFVAFRSSATNLVAKDTNGVADIFVFDRVTQRIERVNVSNAGKQANDESLLARISADGRFVVFES